MPLGVYLLVGYQPSQSDPSKEPVFLKLPALGQDLLNRLAEAYRKMPDPLRLVVLLSIYDELTDNEIAELLVCSSKKIRHLLRLADSIFANACGAAVLPENITLMLENEIDSIDISKEVIEHVRKMLREKLFSDEPD